VNGWTGRPKSVSALCFSDGKWQYKNGLKQRKKSPSPAGEGGGEENKVKPLFSPLIPTFSLKGEGAGTCADTYALRVRVG